MSVQCEFAEPGIRCARPAVVQFINPFMHYSAVCGPIRYVCEIHLPKKQFPLVNFEVFETPKER